MFIFFKLFARMKRILKSGVLTILLWSLALNVLFGTAFYFAERNTQEMTWLDGIWWSMVTMTTVGYGDFYAQTFIGRFFISYPCMIIGIGIIGYLVGLVANWIIEWSNKKRKGAMDINFAKHIIICNFPGEEKVLSLVNELRGNPRYAKSRFVLVTETLEELPESLAKRKLYFVKGIPTDEAVLMRANILQCEGVIILSEDPADVRSDDRVYAIGSIIELIEQDRGQAIKTIVELVSQRNVRNAERMHVDGYVAEETLGSCLLAQEFHSPGINKVISQLISNRVGSELYVHKTRLVGKSFYNLQTGALRHQANIQIIGLVRGGKQFLNPSKQMTIEAGDQLIVLAESPQDIESIEEELLSARDPAPA